MSVTRLYNPMNEGTLVMARFIGDAQFDHSRDEGSAIVLTNLGTPDAPTTQAVRRYLAEFLSDPRVVEVPRLIWMCILHGVILRIRPARSARAYKTVWGPEGSPLLAIGKRQASAVAAELERRGCDIPVRLAMRYGNPSLSDVLSEFRGQGLRNLVVLPLYPQYSGATTGSTFDALTKELVRWRRVPSMTFIDSYHASAAYIEALAASIERAWALKPPGDRLLMSFHGLPRRFLDAGDPYHCQCHATARLIAERLGLADERWAVAFQSRVGREPWLKPYTDEMLVEWAGQGVATVDVVCPGFSADCLETLEEIAIGEKERFVQAGGKSLRYIEALNDDPAHIAMIADLVESRLGPGREGSDGAARANRARQLGATR